MHSRDYPDEPAHGLDNEERAFLNYRPEFGYYPKILTKMDPTDAYVMSPLMARVTEILPSSIIDSLSDLLEDISTLQKRMEQCLKDDQSSGISFGEYKKEKRAQKPDYRKVDQYEDYHKNNVNGKLQAEVYADLIDMESEITEYRDFINKQFFDNQVDYDNMNNTKRRDKDRVDRLIEAEIDGKIPQDQYKKLAVQAQLSRCALDRVVVANNFVKDTNKILCYSVSEYYDGNIRDIVKVMADAPEETLEHLHKINMVSFRQSVVNSENDKRRGHRLNSKEIKKGMNEATYASSLMKTESSDNVLAWVESLDTDYDQNPVAVLVADTLDKIELVEAEYDGIILEMYKHNKLDEMQKTDRLDTLLEKKQARQVCNLISDISTEKKNNTFDLDRFLLDRKLESPGTLCTP